MFNPNIFQVPASPLSVQRKCILARVSSAVAALIVLCGWSLFDAHFNETQERTREPSIVQMPLQQEAIDSEDQQIIGIAHGGTKDRSSVDHPSTFN